MQYGFKKRSEERKWHNKNRQAKLRKNALFCKLIENSMKECSHLGRPFKERTNFVMEQLLLERIM